MSELCVPLDYEQLPELWQLRKALADTARGVRGAESPKQIEAVATFIFTRLMVTLGYLAKSTNKPGVLTPSGAQQFQASLEPLFGGEADPGLAPDPGLAIQMLVECQLLQKMEGSAQWHCPLFARLNPHLAGDYKPGHARGNVNSRLSVAMKNIAGEAMQQAMLLPEDVFKKQDGAAMTTAESQGAIILIRTLDRCLMKPSRQKFDFSPGLMATAAEVVGRYDKEKLRAFYYWLANNYEPAGHSQNRR